jgi:sugar phosphate isomerase/epimerase
MIKIACQTIVFGNPAIKDNLAAIAETVKNIGYDGMEIGARHLYQDKPEYYRELFTRLNLKLAALHVGGDFLDRNSVKQQLDNMKDTIAFGKKLGCPYIFLSGNFKEGKTQDNYVTEAESYREIGKACNDEGLKLCYHNHSWEFINDGEGMKVLLEEIPAELMKLVPDVGWLEVAGVASLQFLKDNISRVEALHFKDFKSKTVPWEFTELGTGITPFSDIYKYIAGLNRDWWITAEQDQTKLEPKEAARINYEYIAGLGK